MDLRFPFPFPLAFPFPFPFLAGPPRAVELVAAEPAGEEGAGDWSSERTPDEVPSRPREGPAAGDDAPGVEAVADPARTAEVREPAGACARSDPKYL